MRKGALQNNGCSAPFYIAYYVTVLLEDMLTLFFAASSANCLLYRL